MRRITRYLANVFYKPLVLKWLSKERTYSYHNIFLKIHPQVFHPGFFFSTKILLRYLTDLPVSGKKILELGAGSGLISITAAKAGAIVTATDINPIATEYLQQNRELNQVPLTIITSDLFAMIPQQVFDVIVINPPYYFRTPATLKEYAWYCGRNGEYFHGLFEGLSNYISQNTVILIILCEDSNREGIHSIAKNFGFEFECIKIVHNIIERNYLYQIHAKPGWNPGLPIKQDGKDIII